LRGRCSKPKVIDIPPEKVANVNYLLGEMFFTLRMGPPRVPQKEESWLFTVFPRDLTKLRGTFMDQLLKTFQESASDFCAVSREEIFEENLKRNSDNGFWKQL